MARLKLGVMISGRGSNLQALIDACKDSAFPADIALVISNIPDVQGLERARKAGIPTQVISHKAYASKNEFEEAITAALTKAGVELICMAGFMRIIGSTLLNRWRGRIINIHPSFLPFYPGLHTHKRALEDKATSAGCTVHYVEEGVDTGAIILQAAVPIEPGDTEESLAARVLVQEHKIYPEAVRLIATGAVRYEEGTVIKNIAIALAFLFLLGGPACAENSLRDSEIKIRAGMHIPADMVACKSNEDCAAVDLPCGPTLGIRADRKAEAKSLICAATQNCPASCDGSAVTTPYALCEDGQCWADYRRK